MSFSRSLADGDLYQLRTGGYGRWRGVLDGHEVLVERWPGRPRRAEAAAAAAGWLAQEGRAAAVRRLDGDTLWSALPPGAPAGAPLHQMQAQAVVSALGRALGELHGLDPGGWDVRRTTDDLLAEADARVAAGGVEAAELRPPYQRFGSEGLLALARSSFRSAGGDEALVVGHGACSVDHLVLDAGLPTVWLHLDTVALTDRHLDLARLAKEIADRLGPELVPPLFDAYGTTPDLARLDAFALLDELLP